MGFTRKISQLFSGKESLKEPVPFSDIDACIREEISEEEERISDESAMFINNILECVEELARFLETLREKEREDMFKKLENIVKSSQKRFADSLKNVVTRISIEKKDYPGLMKFHREVTEALNQMQKLNKMHGRYLYIAFDKEMKGFTKTVKEMAANNHLLGKLLQSEGRKINLLTRIDERISERKELKREMTQKEKEEAETRTHIEKLKEDTETLEKKVVQLESSGEYQEATDLKQRREKLSATLKSVEKEIYNILHPLDRDFRKFKRQVELGNISFDLNLLEEYEPLTESFLREPEGYPDLKKIAHTMREALETQAIKEKGHKKEKVLDILQSILDGEMLEYQQKYHSVKTQLETTSLDTDITEKIRNVKKEIETRIEKYEELEKRLENVISRKKDIGEDIEKYEEEIREQCSKVGIEIA